MADQTPENPEVEPVDATPEVADDVTPEVAPEAAAPAGPGPSPSTPKERKVAARERRGKRRPSSPEERDELRKAKAVARSRRRIQERAKAKERKAAAPAAPAPEPKEHGPGQPKVRLGKVVSDKADKTITVKIDDAKRHRRYEKIVRSSMTLHAHDETNDANAGDLVRVIESRPLSRTKRWRLVEVLERAK
jgi:small subunit ribosomal protein S17